jgi:hypothetical protein
MIAMPIRSFAPQTRTAEAAAAAPMKKRLVVELDIAGTPARAD